MDVVTIPSSLANNTLTDGLTSMQEAKDRKIETCCAMTAVSANIIICCHGGYSSGTATGSEKQKLKEITGYAKQKNQKPRKLVKGIQIFLPFTYDIKDGGFSKSMFKWLAKPIQSPSTNYIWVNSIKLWKYRKKRQFMVYPMHF